MKIHSSEQVEGSLLATHLDEEHKQSAVADYFKEVIYGGIDGIITTFAVVAGFTGASVTSDTATQLSFVVVLLFGLANLCADGASMGLGNFLATRSDQDLYKAARKREEDEIEENADGEFAETVTLLVQKGFSSKDATQLATIYRSNPSYWVDFMMNHELNEPDPRGDNPILTGLATFLSFIVFGIIPLIPFMLVETGSAREVFVYSVLCTASAMLILAVLKWRIVGSGLLKSLFEVLLVGSTAAIIAFTVGTFFG